MQTEWIINHILVVLGMTEQPDMGGQMSFNTPEEAEAANLPVGTVIMIGGRKAVIE